MRVSINFFFPLHHRLSSWNIYIYISDTLVKRYLVARKKKYIYIFVFYNIVFNNVRETSCFHVHSYSRESQDFHSLAFHEYITAELWRNWRWRWRQSFARYIVSTRHPRDDSETWEKVSINKRRRIFVKKIVRMNES